MILYKEARLAYRHAENSNDVDALKRAREELDALMLFRGAMGTAYRVLLPLLEFEREINPIDLSKVVLTHHHLRDLGTKTHDLNQAKSLPIPGPGPGGGGVQDKDRLELAEIIAKLNELFSGERSDTDKET